MMIPDLQEFASDHPPSPYKLPLLILRGQKWEHGVLPAGTVLRAVGWIGSEVLSLGDTREECIDKLLLAYERKAVVSDGTMGWHDCEVCKDKDQHFSGGKVGPVVHWRGRDIRLYGHGHYLIRNRGVVYMSPVLLLHYILDHRYRPPDEFVEAVVTGSFLTREELVFRDGDYPKEEGGSAYV